MAILDMDLSDVEASSSSFKSLPDGDYSAMLMDADYKATKSNTGMCLHLKFQITDGPRAGAHIMDFLTLEHETSKQATDIAKARLKQLAIATGCANPDKVNNTEELAGPVTIVIGRKKDSGDFADDDGFVNTVKGYKAKEAAASSNEAAPF